MGGVLLSESTPTSTPNTGTRTFCPEEGHPRNLSLPCHPSQGHTDGHLDKPPPPGGGASSVTQGLNENNVFIFLSSFKVSYQSALPQNLFLSFCLQKFCSYQWSIVRIARWMDNQIIHCDKSVCEILKCPKMVVDHSKQRWIKSVYYFSWIWTLPGVDWTQKGFPGEGGERPIGYTWDFG